jgi:hypothetical protein
MAKERGNIKDAPNKQTIGQAPLNLRSAMRYAAGGVSDSDIGSFVQQNLGNPAAIAQAAQMYQVTAEDLARATGYSPEQISTYFASAGVSGPYQAPQEAMQEPQQAKSPETTRSTDLNKEENIRDSLKEQIDRESRKEQIDRDTRINPEPPRPPREEPPRPPREEPPRPRYEEPPRPPREEPPPPRPRDVTPPPPIAPRYEEPPEIYPVQPTQPRTSYRQDADGTLTEIGYDGQPISSYTPEQTAMDRATRGLDPSEFQYVYNGEGYDKVRTGGITMDDGTFIAGVDNGQGGVNIGTPEFFQSYADQPATMDLLRQMYGFTGDQPVYQEPQIGFNPEPVPTAPQMPNINLPGMGYNEPSMTDPTPETLFDLNRYRKDQDQSEYERLDLLKRAAQGQGLGSLQDSQKLAALLRSMGYSK